MAQLGVALLRRSARHGQLPFVPAPRIESGAGSAAYWCSLSRGS